MRNKFFILYILIGSILFSCNIKSKSEKITESERDILNVSLDMLKQLTKLDTLFVNNKLNVGYSTEFHKKAVDDFIDLTKQTKEELLEKITEKQSSHYRLIDSDIKTEGIVLTQNQDNEYVVVVSNIIFSDETDTSTASLVITWLDNTNIIGVHFYFKKDDNGLYQPISFKDYKYERW